MPSALLTARVAQLHLSVPSAITVPGNGTSGPRSYGPYAAGTFGDVPLPDVADLSNAGIAVLGLSCPTSARPLRSDPGWPFIGTSTAGFASGSALRCFDTTLNVWLVWDEVSGIFRDAITLAAA